MRKRLLWLVDMRNLGWTIPSAIIFSYGIIALLYLTGRPGLRLWFYALLAVSLIVAIRAITRQIRIHHYVTGRDPSAYHVALWWEKASLLLLAVALTGIAMNRIVPQVPDIPEAFLYAQVAAATIALTITNLIMELGRSGQLRQPADPGPLRPLFRRGRRR